MCRLPQIVSPEKSQWFIFVELHRNVPTVNKRVCRCIYVCVNSHSGNLKSQKGKREKQKQFIFHFHCNTMSRQDWICQKLLRTCKSHFYRRKKNWHPLTIRNIAQPESLCVSNKYLTALFQRFSSLCIPDVVTIYVELKSDNVSFKKFTRT